MEKEKSAQREKPILNAKESAELIGLSLSSFYKGVRKNEIPHKKINSRYFFNREELIEMTRGK